MRVYRGWVNQPSTLQPLHELSGTRCIVVDYSDRCTVDIYFTEGNVHSMRVPRLCISEYHLSSAG